MGWYGVGQSLSTGRRPFSGKSGFGQTFQNLPLSDEIITFTVTLRCFLFFQSFCTVVVIFCM